MTTTVKFELAQLLKEKGYDVPTLSFYFKNGAKGNGGMPFNWNHYKHEYSDFSAPTIAEVVMWLYEKHGIWIETTIGKGHTGIWFDWDIFSTILPRKDDELGEEGIEYEDNPNEKWLNYNTTYSSMINERFATMDKKSCSSPTEAYEAGIEYTLKNLL